MSSSCTEQYKSFLLLEASFRRDEAGRLGANTELCRAHLTKHIFMIDTLLPPHYSKDELMFLVFGVWRGKRALDDGVVGLEVYSYTWA